MYTRKYCSQEWQTWLPVPPSPLASLFYKHTHTHTGTQFLFDPPPPFPPNSPKWRGKDWQPVNINTREVKAAVSLLRPVKGLWSSVEGFQWKLLRTREPSQMCRWISSFHLRRRAEWNLMDPSAEKPGKLFLLFINDIVNTLPPWVTNSLHADDLAAWTSAEQTSTAIHLM